MNYTATSASFCYQTAESYAWAGLNFALYAIGAAIILGVLIALGYSVQDWLKAASQRRAEFINSIRPETVSAIVARSRR